MTLDELVRRLEMKSTLSMQTMESIDGDVDLTVSDGEVRMLRSARTASRVARRHQADRRRIW